MALAEMLTPVSIAIQLIIVILGCYAGYRLKIEAGYLFALAFLLFAVYDITSMMGYGDDMLSIINILASLSALGGIYLLVKQA
ncbi:hypothetical protein [Methanocalculus sp.]|uniref:hypothetical protein n=1 Tax=Methanocalculus sp. TaxID=2004547 RepID=UPI00074738FB|nr:hypothetical protein [Methanocalculus sp.]KUK68819.1 MAG: Uncharacterized protein XD88_1745 [Methanocalculus sp. 52_23]KUL04518.1 MAG: Uncharacterized protein XE11_0589 [Methanomicrobiales archaeon 53_19]MDG6250689.1 hypothetical protein [Methanocalculus sp.]HIJ06480.1 hypothetical protein [Methanocalculus sp.]